MAGSLTVAPGRTFVRCLYPFSLTDEAGGFDTLVGRFDQLNEQANPLIERVNELREQADELREQADELPEQANALRKEANALNKKANALNKKANALSEWEETSYGSLPYVLPHVADFVAPSGARGRAYARGWQLRNDARQRRFGAECVFESTRRGESRRYTTRISGVSLFAFRSGVGVLVLELEPEAEGDADGPEAKGLTLDGLTRFVRAVRAVRSAGGRHRFAFRDGLDDGGGPRHRHATVADVLRGLMSGTVGEESQSDGDSGAWEAFYEHRLLTYTYALVVSEGAPPTYDDVAEPLYRLRHAFDFQYEPSEADLDPLASPEVIQTFGNVCLGLSMEGGAMLGLDNGTEFVRDGLAARARGGYFFLFLLVLHQRLGSLHVARRMSEVVGRGPISVYELATTRAVAALRNDFFEFKLRSWFADVSNLTMYTRVYRRWQDVLGVGPVLAEVTSESRELDDYLRRTHDEREARSERTQTRLLNVLTLFFLPLTVVGGLLGMNLGGMTEGASWAWFAVSLIAVYAVVVALVGGPRRAGRAVADLWRGDDTPS